MDRKPKGIQGLIVRMFGSELNALRWPFARIRSKNLRDTIVEKRTAWVDYARAIGIVLVVYGHVARGLFNAGIPVPEPAYALVDSVVYSFHMPLFFFLSGLFFLESLNKRGGRQLILSKVDTIVYPYVLWSIVQGSVEAALSKFTNGKVTWGEVFAFPWAPRAQFWFLYALFLIFVLATILFYVLPKRSAVVLFVLAAILYVAGTQLPRNVILEFVTQNFVYFLFGVVFYERLMAFDFSSKTVVLAAMAAFVVVQVAFHGVLGLNYSNKGFASLVVALVSILAVVAVSYRIPPDRFPFVAYVGSNSMAIYLMHILAGSGVRVILKSFLGVQSFAIHLIAGCVVGLLAPLAVVEITRRLGIPFLFSAPVSKWVGAEFKRSAGEPQNQAPQV